jgi:hypothetical protein
VQAPAEHLRPLPHGSQANAPEGVTLITVSWSMPYPSSTKCPRTSPSLTLNSIPMREQPECLTRRS